MQKTKAQPKTNPPSKKSELELISELWSEISYINQTLDGMIDHIKEMNKQIKTIASRSGIEYDL